MIDCNDSQRRELVMQIAKAATITALQTALEHKMHKGIPEVTGNEVFKLARMIDDVLNYTPSPTPSRAFISRTVDSSCACPGGDYAKRDCRICQVKCDGQGHIMTVQGAGSIKLPFFNSQFNEPFKPCRPEDCPTCLWNNLCEGEALHKQTVDAERIINEYLQWERKDAEAIENAAKQRTPVATAESFTAHDQAEFYRLFGESKDSPGAIDYRLKGKNVPDHLLSPAEKAEKKRKNKNVVDGVNYGLPNS